MFGCEHRSMAAQRGCLACKSTRSRGAVRSMSDTRPASLPLQMGGSTPHGSTTALDKTNYGPPPSRSNLRDDAFTALVVNLQTTDGRRPCPRARGGQRFRLDEQEVLAELLLRDLIGAF